MLKDIPFQIVYSTGENEPIEFFLDALVESNSFDLGLGYFSSTGINVLSVGFAYFIQSGGKMRIIINDILSLQDKEAIEKGINQQDNYFENNILEDIRLLAKTLSKQDEHFFKCLSYLISEKRIEFIATAPANLKGGIAHNKYGLFTDLKGNKVGFNGSANFSKNALINNIESISCYKSWSESTSELKRLSYFEEIFNKTWIGKSENVKIIPIEKVKSYIQDSFPVEDLQELIEEEKYIVNTYSTYNVHLRNKINKLYSKNNHIPQFPFINGPHNYQKQAYKNWKKNNFNGIFAMATGTGKTITSLNCVLEEYNKNRNYQVLILVPTIVLLHQWISETEKFRFPNIISSIQPEWEKLLSTQFFLASNEKKTNFIFITTYATFNGRNFQLLIRNKKLRDVILICDEVHNLGSKNSLKNLPINIEKRIGLSATPNRIYDEHGSIQIENFFNSFSPCYTYSFSMQKAIEQNFLTKYEYYPYLATLNYDELKEYKELSKDLLKHYDFKKNIYKESANFLLIKRKRIIHQAENKKEVFSSIIKEIRKNEGEYLKHVLVYVPEGFENNYAERDSYITEKEDQRIITEYSKIISGFNISTHQLLSETKNRSEILKKFENGKISVLTSMKTLDEGVDVPATKYAIFCASTGNPRQFIQRRGRILRKFPGKEKAFVYDIIITPNLSAWDNEPIEIRRQLLKMEVNIFKNEIYRVANFLYACENRIDITLGQDDNLKKIIGLASSFDINLDGLLNDLTIQDSNC
ncbi:MAG: DEAD/DEAH box helicase family protein [Prolixibacteraceae bacterium]|jgi:superfamily II DNA or RNA helicase|nr:DEAD/DEAH box helicase family protein [Prolixibacteraceae bacterium]